MGSGETTPTIVVWQEDNKFIVNRIYGIDRMYDYTDEFDTFEKALDWIKLSLKEDFPTEFRYPKNYYGGIDIGYIVFCDKDMVGDEVGLVVKDENNFRELLNDLKNSKISPSDLFSVKFQEENEKRYSVSEILEKALLEEKSRDWDM